MDGLENSLIEIKNQMGEKCNEAKHSNSSSETVQGNTDSFEIKIKLISERYKLGENKKKVQIRIRPGTGIETWVSPTVPDK